jgi:hypothetical protein
MTSPEVQRNKSMVPQATYRTRDLSLTRRLLFHLSYRGKIHFGCTFARVAGMKPHQVLSLRRRAGYSPTHGTSHASFPRLRHVVLQRHTRNGADSRPRTDDIEFGKLTLCQLSYVRINVRLAPIQWLVRPHGKLLKTPAHWVRWQRDHCLRWLTAWLQSVVG